MDKSQPYKTSGILDDMAVQEIRPADNAELALIIRQVLTEFGANRPGTVYFDATTDALYQLFRQDKAVYYVARMKGKIVGGAGIFPTAGLPSGTCELVKMYLFPAARGTGLAQKLIQKCLDTASASGFTHVYLETMPELGRAVKVYERFGFKYLDSSLGNSGHFGCNIWMLKELTSS